MNLTVVDEHAFEKCASLTALNVPAGVSIISSSAFESCTSLTNVTIGAGVTEIDADAFKGCTALDSVRFDGAAGPFICSEEAFADCPKLDVVIVSKEFDLSTQKTLCGVETAYTKKSEKSGSSTWWIWLVVVAAIAAVAVVAAVAWTKRDTLKRLFSSTSGGTSGEKTQLL